MDAEKIVNYYQILDIPVNAPAAEIQQAMRRWMQSAPRNDETLAVLNGCKTHLLNPENRKQYNRELLLAYPELLDQVMQQTEQRKSEPPKRANNSASQRQKAAQTTQHHAEKEGSEKRGCADFFALIGTGLVLSVIFSTCSGKGSNSSSSVQLSKSAAQVACQDAVSNMLKSPASAKFDNWTHTPNADGSFTVTGTVDSQNSFGAMLRSRFSCQVRDKGNGISGTVVEYLQ